MVNKYDILKLFVSIHKTNIYWHAFFQIMNKFISPFSNPSYTFQINKLLLTIDVMEEVNSFKKKVIFLRLEIKKYNITLK